MFTPELLIELAISYHDDYAAGPAGVRNDKQMTAFRLSRQAETCALWLETFGNGEPVASIGPFGNVAIKRGDRVRIKKGAKLLTTHPAYKRNHAEGYDKLAGRTYVVTVHDSNEGRAPAPGTYHMHRLRGEVRNQTVHWVGEGGYWFWTDISNVELV